jgi:predicted TIM-barrel fold metal-dependent hydrolase
MEIVDFLRFPVDEASERALSDMSRIDLSDPLASTTAMATNFAIFDSGFVFRAPQAEAAGRLRQQGRLHLSYLPPIGSEIAFEAVDRAHAIGFSALIFHPYIQKISGDSIDSVLSLAKRAAAHGMLVIVCTAFGGRGIYQYRPLEVALAIAEGVSGPVVFAHCGGAKILEAMLIAEAWSNVILETSFSLSYWAGSSVETDIAFAMKKLGFHRWAFGSDAPFLSYERAVADHLSFFDRHRIGDAAREQVMSGTSRALLS